MAQPAIPPFRVNVMAKKAQSTAEALGSLASHERWPRDFSRGLLLFSFSTWLGVQLRCLHWLLLSGLGWSFPCANPDLPWFGFLFLRNRYFENAIVEFSIHLLRIHRSRQSKRTDEPAVLAFNTVEVLF